MKIQETTASREALLCKKLQTSSLKISSELIGVLLWVNKFSAVLLKLVQ